LRRSVEEGTTEEISRAAFGGKVIDEDGGKRANEEAAPAVEEEMNNNVMVKEELSMEQSSDEDSDDVEVELMEEEESEVQMKRLEEESRRIKEMRNRENETAEGDECDKWEEDGDATLTVKKVACELCGNVLGQRSLRSHMRFKHGCKAIKCPMCSKKVYSLKFHKCPIKESDLVGCEVCGERVTKKLYRAHMKKEHGWGPTKFPKCSRCGRRMSRLTNHKCPLSKTKSTCPDCGVKNFYLGKHLGTNVCKLRAAANERRKQKVGRVEDSSLLKIGGPASPPHGSPSLPPTPELRKKSCGKAKPAMMAAEPACEYERVRAANIAEREAMFQALGIQGHVREVKEK